MVKFFPTPNSTQKRLRLWLRSPAHLCNFLFATFTAFAQYINTSKSYPKCTYRSMFCFIIYSYFNVAFLSYFKMFISSTDTGLHFVILWLPSWTPCVPLPVCCCSCFFSSSFFHFSVCSSLGVASILKMKRNHAAILIPFGHHYWPYSRYGYSIFVLCCDFLYLPGLPLRTAPQIKKEIFEVKILFFRNKILGSR